MSQPEPGTEERVLLLAPTARDGARCCGILAEAGVPCSVCADMADLLQGLEVGTGAAVLPEEALADEAAQRSLEEAVGRQPPWSDLPIIVLTGAGADSPLALFALKALGNVTLLERPLRVSTFISAVRAALRARRRQYQVRDHLAEREATAAALREANGHKDAFLAMLGHELRNPLAPIRNALHILRLRHGGDLVTEQLGAMMERQVAHMVRLVDDLLDVSRVARGKLELRKERVPLRGVLERAVEDVRPALEERRHHLEVCLPPASLWVEGDPARLEQVVSNLLTNAAKYTEMGGHITLWSGGEGSEAVVRVRDDGIGIRPEMQTRIFEMFAQADRVSGRLLEGLGLGLSLVRSLVEMHGGSVTAFSEGPGRGSEFVVRLPAVAGDRPQAAPVPEAARPAARALRVLVVDDNVDGARSLATLLRLSGGHEVRVAHDGPAALREAHDFRPAAVLLDIGLPRMDGLEVARRLRRDVGLSDAVLVAVTGYGQPEDRRRSREAGFDHHLVKPVSPEAVQELLAEVARRCP